MNVQKQIGQPLSRLEGSLKVTGSAKYAADYQPGDMLFGYVINSTITKGKIVNIDASEALELDGVEEVITYQNRISLAWFNLQYADMDAPPGVPFRPLRNEDILFNGQPIGLVVAKTFELARYAATLVRFTYEKEPFEVDLRNHMDRAKAPSIGLATALKPLPPKPTGDFDAAFEAAPAKVSAEFYHGTEHHNPMELFATTTIYEGEGKLTIYDKTQGTINSQLYVANVFGLKFKDVRVIAPYVGGAFGSGLRPQYQLFLSVLAALKLKKSVQVMLDRSQMYTFGHRPPTWMQTNFAADKAGKLIGMNHKAISETSRFEDYTEVVVNWSHMLYPAHNTLFEHKLVGLDVFTPMDMRAPGGVTGVHAIESTMDELSYKLGIDPLELRLINYAATDPSQERPFSSKELRKCYTEGAERFGWSQRNPLPRSAKRGHKLVGYGMATGIWDAFVMPAKAAMTLTTDGKLLVDSAVTDIGTGTLTVMTQIAADEFGLPMDSVSFAYGDSKKPFAPIQGGSFTVATVGSAVKAAAKALKEKLLSIAVKLDKAGFGGLKVQDLAFGNGDLFPVKNPERRLSLAELVAVNGKPVRVTKFSVPSFLKLRKYSRAVHCASFVEVEVDEELGIINVTRAVTAVAAGNIINPKTARSQILGGMVWGIGKTLREETIQDAQLGKYMNQNLGEYHIPVHADIHELDVIFVEEQDQVINELGAKGVGEIGIVAMPPAITNAIYHATGKRVNQLPVHLDALL